MPKEKGDEWEHVIIIGENNNLTFSKVRCIYCNKLFQGGVLRIRGHLLGEHKSGISKCTEVPIQVQEVLKKQQSNRFEVEARRKRIRALDEATTSAGNIPINLDINAKKQVTLSSMFVRKMSDDADKAVARLFYACGIPFSIADSPFFKAAMTAVAKCDSSYKTPNRQRISSQMLADEVHDVQKYIESFKKEALKHGVTLMSDGWTDVNNKPIINFLVATGDGCIFLKSVDTSGTVKNASFIADELSKSIESFGIQSVVQVVTDSASNCVAARSILEQKYPQIVFSPCTVHCLDLLLEDLGIIPWIFSILTDSKNIVKFITTHQYSQACFRKHSKLELLKPGQTRFATNFIMVQRLLTVKGALQETVISREYKKWLTEKLYRVKGEAITNMILNEIFWCSVEALVALCEPLIQIMRLADGNVPCVGKIYWKMWQIEKLIQDADLPSINKKPILDCFTDRWRMLHTDLHAAGFVLDPEYCDLSQYQNEEVITGFHSMIERIFSDSIQLQVQAVQQHAIYRERQGLFARKMAIAAAKEMPAYKWWMSFGAHVPELQQVAIRVLAQVTSASHCERNWSTFDFIHTKKRNRLQSKRVSDIVFVHANIRLKNKLENINYIPENIEWDDQSSDEDTID